jgi:putative acetyltransferase
MRSIDAPTLVPTATWGIRPEQPVDIDQIHDLHRAAFGREAEAELVDAIRASNGFVPELSLVAVTDDGSVLGHALVSIIGFTPDEAGGPTVALALAPLAVLPARQREGIGSALTRAALQLADERDEPLVAVLGSPAFFGSFGFVAAADVGVHGPYDTAGEAFQVRATGGVGAVPAGVLEYPAPFSGF